MYDNHIDNNIILTQPHPYAEQMPTRRCRGETCSHLAQTARHDATHERDLAALRAEKIDVVDAVTDRFITSWFGETSMTRGRNGSRLPTVRHDYLRISRDPWSVGTRDGRLVTGGWDRSNMVGFFSAVKTGHRGNGC